MVKETWEGGMDLKFLNKEKHHQEQPCSLFVEILVCSLLPPVVQGSSVVLPWSGTTNTINSQMSLHNFVAAKDRRQGEMRILTSPRVKRVALSATQA